MTFLAHEVTIDSWHDSLAEKKERAVGWKVMKRRRYIKQYQTYDPPVI